MSTKTKETKKLTLTGLSTAAFAQAILAEKGIPKAFNHADETSGEAGPIMVGLLDMQAADDNDLDNELCGNGTTRDMLTRIMSDETWKGPVAEQYRREAKRRVDGGKIVNASVATVISGAHSKHKPVGKAHRKVDADGLTALEREVLEYGKKTGQDDMASDEEAIRFIHDLEAELGTDEALNLLDPELAGEQNERELAGVTS